MAKTYKLDIRYIPEAGINALRRVERLIATMSKDGFEISNASVFDDGMRVSVLVETENEGHNELRLLGLVSGTGAIGRFSCRDASEITEGEPAAAETALA